MTLPPDTVPMLLAGAVQGAIFALVALAVRPYTRPVLLAVLAVAALAYVGFAVRGGAGPAWVVAEALGVAVYVAVGARGLRGSLGWLAAGWALHPLWDVALHVVGPGAAFAPASYAVPCLTFDLVVAGAVALVAAREAAAGRSRPTEPARTASAR